LYDAIERLKNVSEIGIHEFGEEDIVRNAIIGDILKRYE
jgi:phosphate starvation-inducible protein PhoH